MSEVKLRAVKKPKGKNFYFKGAGTVKFAQNFVKGQFAMTGHFPKGLQKISKKEFFGEKEVNR